MSCCNCNNDTANNSVDELSSEDQKVYCVNCAYFNKCRRSNARNCYDGNYTHETCNAPQNIRPTYLSDGSNKYVSIPSTINKFNNCKWFVPCNKPSDLESAIDEHNKNHASHPYILSLIENLTQKVDNITCQNSDIVFDLTIDQGVRQALTYILMKLGVNSDSIIVENESDPTK